MDRPSLRSGLAVLLAGALVAPLVASAQEQAGGVDRSLALQYAETHLAADDALREGELDEARRLFEACLELAPGQGAILYGLACTHARAGREDEALGALRGALDAGYHEGAVLRWDPDLESLRGKTAFQVVATEMDASEAERVERLAKASRRDRRTGRALARGPITYAGPKGVRGGRRWFAFDPTGETILLMRGDGWIVRLDTASGAMLEHVLEIDDGRAWSYSPDGSRLAVLRRDGTLEMHRLSGPDRAADPARADSELAPEWTAEFETPPDPEERYPGQRSISWSPTGSHLVVTGEHGGGGLWSAGGEELRRWAPPFVGPAVERLAWHPSRPLLVVGVGQEVRSYELSTGELTDSRACPSEVTSATLSPDGNRLFTGHPASAVAAWTYPAHEPLWEQHCPDGLIEYWITVVLRPAVGTDYLAASTATGYSPFVVRQSTGELIRGFDYHGGQGTHDPGSIAWSPSGERFWFWFPTHFLVGSAAIEDRTGWSWITPGGLIEVAPNGLGATGGAPLTLFDSETGSLRWRRWELEGGVMLEGSGGYFTCPADLIERAERVEALPEQPWRSRTDLVEHVLDLFDPRRVRASMAGIEIHPRFED